MEEDERDLFVNKSHYTRGMVLDHAILFERVMDEFISFAFSDNENKRRDIMHLIISEGTSFRHKVKLVLRIIRNRIPDQHERKTRFGPLQKNLDDLIALRNKFAHEITYVHPNNAVLKNYSIILYNYAKDKATPYTPNDIGKHIAFINEQRHTLAELRKEFWAQ